MKGAHLISGSMAFDLAEDADRLAFAMKTYMAEERAERRAEYASVAASLIDRLNDNLKKFTATRAMETN